MNEAFNLEIAGQATDSLMKLAGCESDWVPSGRSYFTVETHILHLNEVREGQVLTVTTRVMDGTGKKMHLFHRISDDADNLSSTTETLLLHVDLNSRKTPPPSEEIVGKFAKLEEEHKEFGVPEGAGRHVGQRKSDNWESAGFHRFCRLHQYPQVSMA